MIDKIVSLKLPVKLLDHERQERANELADKTHEARRLDADIAEEKGRSKKAVDIIESRLELNGVRRRELADAVKTGFEPRDVECRLVIDPPSVITVRGDTGEIVSSRAATQDELQREIEWQQENAVDEAVGAAADEEAAASDQGA